MIDLTSASSAPTSSSFVDKGAPIWSRGTAAAAGAMAVLIGIADILFYNHEPGIGLALYGSTLIAAVAGLFHTLTWGRQTIALRRPGRRNQVPFDWQSWTWRQERLRRYLAEHPFAPTPAARHN
jgi:hypothetical protein